MLDLDRFIIELNRVTKVVHFYDEIYGQEDSIKVLTSLSRDAAFIIQRSVHNDIIMSVSCLLYDGEAVGNENLSLRNLSQKYSNYIDAELEKSRDKIKKVKEKLDIKSFRDRTLAHKDKATLIGEREFPKHNIETSDLLNLLNEARILTFGIRRKLAVENEETRLPIANGSVNWSGVGYRFIQSIRKMKG
jgi:hypothetical protein